jgi:hypothetical protein
MDFDTLNEGERIVSTSEEPLSKRVRTAHWPDQEGDSSNSGGLPPVDDIGLLRSLPLLGPLPLNQSVYLELTTKYNHN